MGSGKRRKVSNSPIHSKSALRSLVAQQPVLVADAAAAAPATSPPPLGNQGLPTSPPALDSAMSKTAGPNSQLLGAASARNSSVAAGHSSGADGNIPPTSGDKRPPSQDSSDQQPATFATQLTSQDWAKVLSMPEVHQIMQQVPAAQHDLVAGLLRTVADKTVAMKYLELQAAVNRQDGLLATHSTAIESILRQEQATQDKVLALQVQLADLMQATATAATATSKRTAPVVQSEDDWQRQPDQDSKRSQRRQPPAPPRPATRSSGTAGGQADDRHHIGSSYELTKSNMLYLEHTPPTTAQESLHAAVLRHLEAPDAVAASVVVTEKVWGRAGAAQRRVFEVSFCSHVEDCYDVRARVHNAMSDAAADIRGMHPECARCYPDYALTAHGRDQRTRLQAARTALIAAGRPPVWRNGVELWAPAAHGSKRVRALVTADEIAALMAAPQPAAAPSTAAAGPPVNAAATCAAPDAEMAS